jgi:hypothetical protein
MQQGLNDELYNKVNCAHDLDEFSTREKLAIDFAERFAIDHTAVDEKMWAQLREHFTDTEIVDDDRLLRRHRSSVSSARYRRRLRRLVESRTQKSVTRVGSNHDDRLRPLFP